MTKSRDSRFNSGQASRIRVYASQIKAVNEEIDGWFLHKEAKTAVEDWDRSVLRRLNQSGLIRQRDAPDDDQKQWRIPENVVEYIEKHGYA